MNNVCNCFDCETTDVPCNFDCDSDSMYICEGCRESLEADMDRDFDIMYAQGIG